MPKFFKRLLVFLILFSTNIADGITTANGGVKFSPNGLSASFTLPPDISLNFKSDAEQEDIANTAIDLDIPSYENTRLVQLPLQLPLTSSDILPVTLSPRIETLNVAHTPNLYVNSQVVPISTVPEPETYVMLLAGLSVIGFMRVLRHRG